MGARHLGIELPPVPGGASLAPWWEAARSAAAAGATAVWFSGAPPCCDPCTIASGAAAVAPAAHLGVVSAVPGDRNPSILARDVTALDVVSGGRAAVLFRCAPPAARDLAAAWERLAEAVTVCRAVLSGPDPVFEGRLLHLAGALNRPGPPQGAELPVLVEAATGAAAFSAWAGSAAHLAHDMLAAASGLVCRPAEVPAWREQMGKGGARALVCRATLAGGMPDTRRLRSARDAGADGVILAPGGLPRHGGPGDGRPPGAAQLLEALGAAFEPWRAE